MDTARSRTKPPPLTRLAGLALALVACHTPARTPRAPWMDAIEARTRELETLFAAGNLLGVADLYADDAEIVDAEGHRTRGRAELDAYWSGMENPLAWRLETHALRGSEAIAYQLGRSQLSLTSEGVVHTFVSDFLIVWRRAPGGAWQIELDAYWPAQ